VKGIGEAEIELFCDALLLSIVEFLHEFVIDDVITSWVHVLAYVCMEMTRDKIRFMPREHHLQRTGRLAIDCDRNTSMISAENGLNVPEVEAADGVEGTVNNSEYSWRSSLPSFHSAMDVFPNQSSAATQYL
jgi:hypothetical protein